MDLEYATKAGKNAKGNRLIFYSINILFHALKSEFVSVCPVRAAMPLNVCSV